MITRITDGGFLEDMSAADWMEFNQIFNEWDQ